MGKKNLSDFPAIGEFHPLLICQIREDVCVFRAYQRLCVRKILCSGKFPGLVLKLLDSSCGICHFWSTSPGYSFSGYFFP